jgi:hypothetical protein
MARNGNPSGNPNPNPGSPPTTAPPPPPTSAPTGPTGTSGFSVGESAIDTLRKHATDLEGRYQGVSTQLTAQKLAINALGMFGIPMAVAVNGSNSNSVDKTNQASATMGKVDDALKATAETQTKTDQFVADQFGKIVPDSGAKNPQGAPASAPPPQTQSGPQVSKVEPPPGTTGPAPVVTPSTSGPQVSKVEPPPGVSGTTNPAGAPIPQGGPQVSQYTPPPGADTTSPAAAPNPQGGPQVGQYTPPPGAGNVPSPSVPSPQGGPQVTPYTPPTGAGNVPPPSMPKPPTGPPVNSYTPPSGAGSVPSPSTPSPQGGPQVNSYTPPAGAPGTTNTAWTPPPIPDPVARIPGVPGASGVPSPNTGNNSPNSSIISQMPQIPGANGPVNVPDRPNIPTGRPPAGGPLRPGAVPNVPGVDGPPKGEFSKPTTSATDSLRPINTAFPPQGPSLPPPLAPVAPPPSPSTPMPASGPFPPGQTPPIPDVVPVKAPVNILDLIDPGKDQHGTGAWPATTIDGKPWTDLEDFTNLPPEQRQMWINNFRNLLATKEDGAFFWSGNVWDAQGERISVMYEAEAQAHDKGRNTLEGMLDDRAVKMPGWAPGDAKIQELWDSVSSSVAHGSNGEVYVLLGPSRRPDNVFDMNEFPILEQNDAVRKVIAIDLMNNNSETVILDKGRR